MINPFKKPKPKFPNTVQEIEKRMETLLKEYASLLVAKTLLEKVK